MHPFRIFISYSHEDKATALAVVDALRALGLRPVWDADIVPGTAFSESIQWKIARAHVFLPLLTPASLSRPWVHEETGFAKALHIPVLPLAISTKPDQMIRELQALPIPENLTGLHDELRKVNWELLVDQAANTATAVFICQDHSEQRAMLLADAAQSILSIGEESVRVRQSGAMSSFSLPAEPVDDQIWDDREESAAKRYDHARELKREERIWFEQHARECGCDLVIDPYSTHYPLEPLAHATRLTTLQQFLTQMDAIDNRVNVVIRRRQGPENTAILGDWFMAQSLAVKPREGYQQVVATWHAPTVYKQLRRFEKEFDQLINKQREAQEGRSSRVYAIATLQDIIESLHPQCVENGVPVR